MSSFPKHTPHSVVVQAIRGDDVGGVDQALLIVGETLEMIRSSLQRSMQDAVPPFIQRCTGDLEVPHGSKAVFEVPL